MSDPILRRIYDLDVQEFDVSVRAIIALSEDAAAGIAALDFLPEEVMRELAGHDSTEVRRALARNHACSPEVLARLAVDRDEWVRYSAVRNPRASEQDRVAFALVSSPSEVERASGSRLKVPPEMDPATPPEVLRKIAEDELQKVGVDCDLRLRCALGANPSLPQDLVARLVEAAIYPREWGSLWGRGHSMWPSTHAFLSEGAPEWLIALLARHGHPAGLLYRGVTVGPSHLDPAGALRDLINSELLVRALWRELALAGVVELVYWNEKEGDQFFPRANGLELMDDHTAGQCIIGGYSSSREWLATSDSLEDYAVFRLAAGGFEDWFFDIDEDFDEASLGLFALSGVAWISEMGYAPIRWTPVGQGAVDGPLRDAMLDRSDPEDYDTEVTVVASRLPGIGYAQTCDEQKASLTDLIRQSRKDPIIKTWGLADHFLMCIALHSSTPPVIRDELLSDPSENVRQAAVRGRVANTSATDVAGPRLERRDTSGAFVPRVEPFTPAAGLDAKLADSGQDASQFSSNVTFTQGGRHLVEAVIPHGLYRVNFRGHVRDVTDRKTDHLRGVDLDGWPSDRWLMRVDHDVVAISVDEDEDAPLIVESWTEGGMVSVSALPCVPEALTAEVCGRFLIGADVPAGSYALHLGDLWDAEDARVKILDESLRPVRTLGIEDADSEGCIVFELTADDFAIEWYGQLEAADSSDDSAE